MRNRVSAFYVLALFFWRDSENNTCARYSQVDRATNSGGQKSVQTQRREARNLLSSSSHEGRTKG
jgi:hypothetical protein